MIADCGLLPLHLEPSVSAMRRGLTWPPASADQATLAQFAQPNAAGRVGIGAQHG